MTNKVTISDKNTLPTPDSTNEAKKRVICIPKSHDWKLIKDGCKHTEGSKEIEIDNIIPAIEATCGVVEEHIVFSFRAKDKNGWYIAICGIGLADLEPGTEIEIPAGDSYPAKRLVVMAGGID